jgi:hypothetical protein
MILLTSMRTRNCQIATSGHNTDLMACLLQSRTLLNVHLKKALIAVSLHSMPRLTGKPRLTQRISQRLLNDND